VQGSAFGQGPAFRISYATATDLLEKPAGASSAPAPRSPEAAESGTAATSRHSLFFLFRDRR
jgi:hypothetical protein